MSIGPLPDQDGRRSRFPGILLAFLPVVSFALQYVLSIRAGTVEAFWRHFTVVWADWAFVPFNFVVARTINWKRGGVLFAAILISVPLNVAAHANWQYSLADGGHMVTWGYVVLPAGWVHLAFSTIQMVLVLAFVFARVPSKPAVAIASIAAVVYFVLAGVGSYLMHRRIVATDWITFAGGLLLVLGYPRCAMSHGPRSRSGAVERCTKT